MSQGTVRPRGCRRGRVAITTSGENPRIRGRSVRAGRKPGRGFTWLPDLDLNQDKQIQSLLCYRYTIGQPGAAPTVGYSR